MIRGQLHKTRPPIPRSRGKAVLNKNRRRTMANIYKMFQTDKGLETEGIWYNFDKTTGFRLARAGGANMKFVKALEERTRPYRRQIEDNTIDPELANGLLIEA